MIRYREREADYRIDKVLRKVIAVVVVMAFIIPFITPKVFAASSVIISTKDEIVGGDTFTVTVTFDGGNIGRVDAQMLYDTNLLTYISGGSSSGNTGYIQLKKAGTEGSITFNLEFQAVSEGNATLEVTTNEMYDLDEIIMDSPTASKTISISGNAEQEEMITETASPEEPEEPTELLGVDEKPDEETSRNSAYLNIIFIVAAVVLVIMIVIISIILARKKKNSRKEHSGKEPVSSEAPFVAPEEGYQQAPRIGRSGRPLDQEVAYDRSGYDDREYERERYDREEYDRIEKEVIRKRAREETEFWNDWDLGDDGPDDIEKW